MRFRGQPMALTSGGLRPLACAIASVVLVVASVDAQQSSPSATLTTQDIRAMPRTSVTVTEEGRDVKYEGVLVGEVLARAGAPLGRDLSGAAVATYVVAAAK